MKTSVIRACTCVLAGAILFLHGCGGADQKPEQPAASTTSAVTTTTTATTTTTTTMTTRPIDENDLGKVVEKDFTLSVAGMDVKLLDDAAPLLAALGEPERVAEDDPSGCWTNLIKGYYYPSIWVSTAFDKDGTEKIDSLFIRDTSIPLYKGITVGSSKEDLIAAYGEPTYADEYDIQYHCTFGEITYNLLFSFEISQSNTVDYISFHNDYFSL